MTVVLELQNAVLDLVKTFHGGALRPTPAWLQRPGPQDCRQRWPLVQRIYGQLTGLELPDDMPLRERRTVDAVLQRQGEPPRIVEVDEAQHFNRYRAMTIRAYPRSACVAFDGQAWLAACDSKQRLEGGGFGKARPPLFPGDGGRHRQRAFRDALADLLPAVHGWLPTLRIADFEVGGWMYGSDAGDRMNDLLVERL
ncbi:MAG: hypothetical protein WKF96_13880 [Solirubrobacteraceae bacterium]